MTAIALTAADAIRVVESLEQATLPLGETLVAGDCVRLDANGDFTGANGTTAAEAQVYGILVVVDPAGKVGTALRRGVIDGLELTALAYGADIFLSDTDKALDTAAGTVSKVVGEVFPGTAVPIGTAKDKLARLDFSGG